MDEAQIAHSIFANASQIEKMGIVTILFLVCMALLYLLKKASSDKAEVLKLLETHKTEMHDLLDRDREDRMKLYDKVVEGIAKTNQSIEEMKNLSRQNQEMMNTLFKSIIDRGGNNG